MGVLTILTHNTLIKSPYCFVGLFFIYPCIDEFLRIDIRTISMDIPPQEVSLTHSYSYILVKHLTTYCYYVNVSMFLSWSILECTRNRNTYSFTHITNVTYLGLYIKFNTSKFYWSACILQGKCVRCINLPLLKNFLLNFRTVTTMW